MRLVTRGIVALTLAGALLAGCGDGEGRFDDQVAAVRTAVDRGDRAGAGAALDDLTRAADAALADGDIGDGERREIAELVESSRALLDDVVPTTTTSTTSTTTTTAAPPPPEKEDKGKRGDDKGKKGDKDDDEDDDD